MTTALLPSTYLGPVQYYQKIKEYENCLIEHHEHFTKQTYRSRCDIYSPNGKLTLSIPIVHRNKRQAMKEVKISYDYDWQNLHWRSLESSYRRSPFFEYFEDDFLPFYSEKKYDFLIDFNEAIQQVVLSLLKIKKSYHFTESYKETYADTIDYREIISPKTPLQSDTQFQQIQYSQVFEPRHGFIENLSIVDLLFNQGSRAMDYL